MSRRLRVGRGHLRHQTTRQPAHRKRVLEGSQLLLVEAHDCSTYPAGGGAGVSIPSSPDVPRHFFLLKQITTTVQRKCPPRTKKDPTPTPCEERAPGTRKNMHGNQRKKTFACVRTVLRVCRRSTRTARAIGSGAVYTGPRVQSARSESARDAQDCIGSCTSARTPVYDSGMARAEVVGFKSARGRSGAAI